MSRAIDIARRGEGFVSPNPLVGAVLVYDNRIISEGWHEKYGEAHAEVNAIRGVDDEILKKSELYVSLEPCNHFGKTPPCSDLIVSKAIPQVFVSVQDPNPLVSGEGIKKMQNAGIKVESGILESEGRELNKRFLSRIEKGRPYIILKWAQSSDGFVAGENGETVYISNEISQHYSHKLRFSEDAIMVGTNTVINDNPRLTNRYWKGKNPLRVSLDFNARINDSYHLLDKSAQTIIYSNKAKSFAKVTYVQIENKEKVPETILKDLAARQINSLIVEGGPKLLNQFISKKLYDEIHVFEGAKKLQKGLKYPDFELKKAEKTRILKEDRYYFFKIN